MRKSRYAAALVREPPRGFEATGHDVPGTVSDG
jgi:hypothetical protein